MRNFILGLLLLFSVNGMAIHVHHFHHFHHHHYTPTKTVHSHKARPVKQHKTKVMNTFQRNGILYYVILNPRRGRVYNDKLELCKGCKKVLVRKGVKYCSKCRRHRN